MGEGDRDVGGEGEGEGEFLIGELVSVVLVVEVLVGEDEVDSVARRGMEMSSEVVDVGDSGLSSFTRSSIFRLLLLLSLRIASIEKDPRLLFSPISSEQLSSTELFCSIPFLLYPHPPLLPPLYLTLLFSSHSLPVRGERDSNKWSEEEEEEEEEGGEEEGEEEHLVKGKSWWKCVQSNTSTMSSRQR